MDGIVDSGPLLSTGHSTAEGRERSDGLEPSRTMKTLAGGALAAVGDRPEGQVPVPAEDASSEAGTRTAVATDTMKRIGRTPAQSGESAGSLHEVECIG